MSDPSDALQGAEFDALQGILGVDNRVFDAVPQTAAFPYIRIGDHHPIGDDDDCEQLTMLSSRIHVWSRATGWPEAKRIAGDVRQRIRTFGFEINGFVVDNVKYVQTLYLDDPDGRTRHAVVEFEYLISHL